MGEAVSYNINDSTRDHILAVVDEILPPHAHEDIDINKNPSHFYFTTSSLHDIIPELSADLDYDLLRAIGQTSQDPTPIIKGRPKIEISHPFTLRYSETNVMEQHDSIDALIALKLSYNGLIKIDDKSFTFTHKQPRISIFSVDRDYKGDLDHRQTTIYTYMPHLGTAIVDKDSRYALSEHEGIEAADTPIVTMENLLHVMQRNVRRARAY